MRIIEFDAEKWKTDISVYDAILSALEAPHWHGYSLNALIDSMVCGDVNIVEPPYTLRFHKMRKAPEPVRAEVAAIAHHIEEARWEHFNIHGNLPEIVFEIVD